MWGWDCHGIPIEERVEKKLGMKNRRDIEKYGINKFLTACATYVNEVTSEWEWYMDKIGSWCDMKHPYRTMDKDYMESVIWVFKTLYDKKLIYQGTKTLLYCTRCGTPVSKFEIAMDDSYKNMEDPAITVEFPVTTEGSFKGVRLLAWTTTPWTMPSNRGLVVDKHAEYVLFEYENKKYIVAEKRLDAVIGSRSIKKIKIIKGTQLLGLSYKPPYDYIPANENDFKVYSYEAMVTMDEGTGIVHSAPGFGEIDTEMGKKHGLTIMLTVDDEGKHIDKITDFKGIYVKDSDSLIIEDLKKRGILFDTKKIVHRYPYCWRCQTPLIQRSVKSWFLNVQDLKKLLIKQNKSINWVPEHLREGRFRYTIETAPDWCISRTRYWATAMPVWECDTCHEREVFGSIGEIEKRSGQKVNGLHRNDVDHILFPCHTCRGMMKRIPEVLDCWMESGSMPVGQLHYPFENKDLFEETFPGDYIIEYIAQVRAWFYYMHVVANAVFKKNSFKNAVVTGVMMGTDGRKMSKSYGNFPDPKKTLLTYGGDAIRLYLMGSPIMAGEDVSFDEIDLKNTIASVINPLLNSTKYLEIYANSAGWIPGKAQNSKNIMDRWIKARLVKFHKEFEGSLSLYHIPQAVHEVAPFLDDLSTWYIRRSRTRFVNGDVEALSTLYEVLVRFTKLCAPLIPFVTEELYQGLVRPFDKKAKESVHLENYPKLRALSTSERKLIEQMMIVRHIASIGLSLREESKLKLRQPISEIRFSCGEKLSHVLVKTLCDELNTMNAFSVSNREISKLKAKKGWVIAEDAGINVALMTELTQELKNEGHMREIIRQVQNARKQSGLKIGEKTKIVIVSANPAVESLIAGKMKEFVDAVCASSITFAKTSDGKTPKGVIFVTIEV